MDYFEGTVPDKSIFRLKVAFGDIATSLHKL